MDKSPHLDTFFEQRNSIVESTDKLIAATQSQDAVPDDSGGYILIPLIVFFGIFILAALVYLMARNRHIIKRKYKPQLRHNAPNHEDDDDDAALLARNELDDPTEYLLNGKLEIISRYNT